VKGKFVPVVAVAPAMRDKLKGDREPDRRKGK